MRRKFFGTLYNTYSFFSRYANVDGFDYSQAEVPVAQRPEIDRWVLSVLNTLVKRVKQEMDAYDPTRAGRLIDAFVGDDLSNWYVRLNRKRFWGTDMSIDKISAYQTLYTCLETVARLLAPFAPFYADQLFTDLNSVTHRIKAESVHLADFPEINEELIDADLEERMSMAQKITSMIHALRKKVNIAVRQPLQAIMIPAASNDQRRHIKAVEDLILSEVNVKELRFVESSGVLVKKVKCNFRTMGKKYGKLMKGIAAAMAALDQQQIQQLEQDSYIDLTVEEQSVRVEAADVEIISEDIPGWLVSNEGNLTVALEVELNDALRNEGMARELISRIQNMRKEKGLEITDRIHVSVQPNEQIQNAVDGFADYIKSQVLALDIVMADNDGCPAEFDGFTVNIKIQKSIN